MALLLLTSVVFFSIYASAANHEVSTRYDERDASIDALGSSRQIIPEKSDDDVLRATSPLTTTTTAHHAVAYVNHDKPTPEERHEHARQVSDSIFRSVAAGAKDEVESVSKDLDGILSREQKENITAETTLRVDVPNKLVKGDAVAVNAHSTGGDSEVCTPILRVDISKKFAEGGARPVNVQSIGRSTEVLAPGMRVEVSKKFTQKEAAPVNSQSTGGDTDVCTPILRIDIAKKFAEGGARPLNDQSTGRRTKVLTPVIRVNTSVPGGAHEARALSANIEYTHSLWHRMVLGSKDSGSIVVCILVVIVFAVCGVSIYNEYMKYRSWRMRNSWDTEMLTEKTSARKSTWEALSKSAPGRLRRSKTERENVPLQEICVVP
eukprot:GEMP01060308.1.p1 GENE.GEMP01060308.1~~GEMP01060308.1.p1  ORF type:complete len:378 (+),score=61.16 GEMP01060308.1:209-1342(+)